MKQRICLLMVIGLLAGQQQAEALTSFILSTNYKVGNAPRAVTVFMNVDGRVDLVSANYSDNTLTVLTNNGSGDFGSNATYAVGSQPDSVLAADVNGDGYVDLICANNTSQGSSGTLTVLTNDGSGSFVIASSPSVGQNPHSVVAADVNGDGYVDLVCGNLNGTLTVLTNDGSGHFTLSSSPSVGRGDSGDYVYSVAAVDVNGDGKVDLISADFDDDELTVLTNNGSGGFVLSSSPGVPYLPGSVTAADVNGDGKVDLITANYVSSPVDGITVLTNNGRGGFVTDTNIPIDAADFVTAADVNGDGKVDLICANQHDNTLTVLTNNGSGGFAVATVLPTGSVPTWVAVADVNGDGEMDLVCAYNTTNIISVFLNTSVFQAPTSTPPLTLQTSSKGISISWPSASAGWLLQQNSDLNTADWGQSGYNGHAISDNSTNKSLTIPSPPGNLFFRLLHP
jgi:hypothetical protein